MCVKGSIWESSKMGKIEPKTEVHTNNVFPPFVLSGRVSHTKSGDRRVL